MVVWYYQRQKN